MADDRSRERGRRWWRKMNPVNLTAPGSRRAPVSQRLANWSEQVGTCQLWTGVTKFGGYGYITVEGEGWRVHRLAWELYHGRPVPDGHDVHHTCMNRRCISPLHLAAVERSEHLSGHRSPTHCRRGHEFTEANAYVNPTTGARKCRRCAADRQIGYNRRRRAEDARC